MQLSGKQKKTFFSIFFCSFEISFKFWTFSKKNDDYHSWDISEITDSEKHGYINV